MESKKINQLATEMSPESTDLTIIGDPITGVSKKVTLLQIADIFSTIGTVTSVGVTETGNALTITGSPITSSGTINIGFAGAASQYVRGDGALADFPTSAGGGSSVSYYLNSSVSQGTIGGVAYRELSKEPVIGAGTDISISANGYIASYITDANDPALLEVPGGNFNCEFYFSVNSNAHNPYIYAELYKYDGTTFTLLGSSQSLPEYLTNGTTLSPYYFAIPVATSALTITDRLAIRIYANVDTKTVTLHTENSHLCQVVTTFSKGLTSLNNLTAQVQYLATGTSGTDFAISSSTATHTFNLPVASATNTGKLSSTDWSTFNNKQSAIGYTPANDSLVVHLAGNETITGVKTFSSQPKLDGTLAIKEGTSGTLTGYTVLGANVNQLLVGVVGATHTLTFNSSSSYGYTFPNATGTLALTSDIPSLTGYVPYTGATGNVTLGVYKLTATNIDVLGANAAIKASDSGAQLILGVNGLASSLVIGSTGDSNFYGQVYLTPAATAIVGMLKTNSSGKILAAVAGTDYQVPITLTTTGTSGAATFSSGTLNIPQYQAAGTYVTSVTGTSPIVSSGGTTPAISITQATTSTSGYLSSTDWTTFNNKQSALTNPVTGTGTSGQVSYFNGTSTITGSNNFKFDGTNLTVGNPSSALAQWHVYNASAAATMLLQTNSTTDYSEIAVRNDSSTATSYFRQYSTAATGSDFGISRAGLALFFSNYATNFAIGTRNGGSLIFGTADTERMRINTSGNVGIGDTTGSGKLFVKQSGTGFETGINSYCSANDSFISMAHTGSVGIISTSYNSTGSYLPLTFATSDTERMRISSGGLVGIGNSSPAAGLDIQYGSSSANTSFRVRKADTITTFYVRGDGYVFAPSVYYFTTGSGANMFIDTDGSFLRSTSSLKYKTDVKDYTRGLNEVMQLRPVFYKGIGEKDKEKQYAGLIAEEVHDLGLTEFVQYAKDGTPDALSYQNMVALLTKAIQEQQKQIEELKAKIK